MKRNFLQKKSFWIALSLVILTSPLLAYQIREFILPNGDEIRLLRKAWNQNLSYFLSSYLIFAGLFAINLVIGVVFLTFSYFAVINLAGNFKNKQSGGFFGILLAAAFVGAVGLKSLRNLTSLLSDITNMNNNFHSIRFTSDQNILFLHDFKGVRYSNPASTLMEVRGVCSRSDEIIDHRITNKYHFTISFVLAEKTLHSEFYEIGWGNPQYYTYQKLIQIRRYLSRPISLSLTKCPEIEKYPPGFSTGGELSGSEPYEF